MTRRSRIPSTYLMFYSIVLSTALLPLATAADNEPSASKAQAAGVEYVVLDAPAGTARAVVVQGQPLVHTRQLLPLDRDGKLVGKGAIDQQIEQVLDNLDAVLKASGSNLNQLVRVNIYALAPTTTAVVRDHLAKRLEAAVRPALTSVLTPLPQRDALVALDAVAIAADKSEQVTLQRCDAVNGQPGYADAAILPRGGVAYLSGVPAEAGLTESAVDASVAGLGKMLAHLRLSPAQVVQLKVFLRPATSAEEVLHKLKAYYPNQLLPPVVFVEWLAPPPVEIELIAQLPPGEKSAPTVEYYNPPDVSPLQIFSRAALVHTDRQIYVGGLFARKAEGGQEQALDVFDQLQTILAKTGSDLKHLAKGTYYACDDGAARGLDRARLWLYDQDRPPAASKCMVHGVGMPQRTLTMDMIAVGAEK
jgi:enamine deaminase RidA (YjgF/YER057c/UK114 family)